MTTRAIARRPARRRGRPGGPPAAASVAVCLALVVLAAPDPVAVAVAQPAVDQLVGAADDTNDDTPILYGLDPFVRTTRDPRLLGVERMILRERLLRQGVDPHRRAQRPTFATAARHLIESRMNVELDDETEVVEANGFSGLYTRFRYPEWFFLFPSSRTLPDGFTYYPPRPVDAPEVEVFVDDVDAALARNWQVQSRLKVEDQLDVAGGGRSMDDEGLINFTIPIKLPRTLESIIGRGEKTQIRISGRERIAIRGETTRSNNFVASEQVQSQSWFPDLTMEQQLQVKLDGQIGEKIFLEVEHDSEAIGPEATKIRLAYRGDEDEIIQSIETGDVGLTLPGGQLLGYNSNQSGLFGIKVTGQLGPAAFTVVASKQKAESDSKSFNSSGGQQTDHPVLASDYLNNRFFRLDLPQNFYGLDHTEVGYEFPDVPGRSTASAIIDRNSIRVYQNMGGITPQTGDIQYVAAAIDTTGIWDPAHVADLSADLTNWNHAWVWRPLDFTSLELVGGDLVAIDLGREMLDSDILAVTYDVIDPVSREVLYEVGDQPEDDAEPGLVIDGQPYYRMKLLKPERTERFTFQYVLRNIYPLGGSNIDPQSFEMVIETTAPVDQPGQHDDSGYTYMNVFGLDVENEQGLEGADGLVDKHRTVLFDTANGLLKFPIDVPFPFAEAEDWYQQNALRASPEGGGYQWEWDGTRLEENLAPEIYDWQTLPQNYSQYGKFRLIPSHAAVSGTINLGASNIEEGSETVTLDGKTLERGVDYDIDYLFGEISIKGERAAELTADSNIQVTYQYAPFFGGGQSSLLGFNVAYDLGPESKLSTTWLYESNKIVGDKAKLGEEPSKTLVGNVNLSHTLRSQMLTDIANVFTLGRRERESTLQFRGEAAVSVPDPNTKDKVYVEDFEGAESSDLITLSRLGWYPASRPVHGAEGVFPGDPRLFDVTRRVDDIRWFLPENRVQRRYLNPELEGQERGETQPTLNLFMRHTEVGGWESGNWGGIMRGLSATGIDLSKSQFLELWINDDEPNPQARRGVLHIDFGIIDEDFAWPDTTGAGDRIYDTWQLEDLNRDQVFNQSTEDVGLDAWVRGQDVVREGVEYSADEGSLSDPRDPYPGINNTRGNNNEDSEDIDGNTRFDQENRFFSITIDLKDTEPLVDVARDYPDEDLGGTSWRKYRIRLTDALEVTDTSAPPDLSTIRHVRIWYEDDAPEADTVELQLSELSFLGSRWEREGIRKVGSEQILSQIEAPPPESFFIGEVNNKDNPLYHPPFPVREENGIPEKETSLVLDVNQLRPEHLVRITKQVSAQGDDYTRYNRMSWYWKASNSDAADLDVFMRVGADSLNYYEISTRFIDMPNRIDWRKVDIELSELTSIKNNEPDEDGVIHGEIADLKDGLTYDVRIVGRPDLRRVLRYYLGVANRTRRDITGQVWLNDIVLEGAKRDIGVAESIGLSLNLADALKVDFDWDRRDAEFHGLNQETGQGAVTEDWGVSTNFRLDDYIPLFGFNLPLSFSRRMSSSRPKYEINSDVEIFDEDRRNQLSSIEDRNTYSLRLSHRPSRNPISRFLIDPWNLSVNGSTTSRDSPTETSDASTLQGSLSYNVNIRGDHRLGDIPVLGSIPLVSGLAYLPSHIEGSASFTSNYRKSRRRDTQGNEFPATETETRPGTLSSRVEFRPLTFLSTDFSNRSSRDLLRRKEVAGINIGEENEYQQSLRVNITLPKATEMPEAKIYAPLRWLVRTANQKLRPDIQFDGSFTDQHDPGRLQPGDPPDLKSVGNSASWRVGGSLPLGDVFDAVIPERRRTGDEQAALIAEQERLMQQARGDVEGQFDPGQIPGWEDMTPDQQQEAKEEWLLEQAELRLEEERRRSGEDGPSAGGGFSARDLVEPLFEMLRELDPVKINYSDQRSSGYGRLVGQEVPLAYRFGFDMTPDFPDTSYDVLRREASQDLSISTATRVSRDIKLDVKYALRESHRIANEQETWSYSQTWPDAKLNVAGIEDWGLFGGDPDDRDAGWFQTSTLTLSYKYTKDVLNFTRSTHDPRRSTNISPQWNMTFHSGMSLNLNGNWSKETQSASGVLTTSDRFRVGVQLKHQISAQRFLAQLGLYRPGNQPSIDMTVDLSYSESSQLRESPNSQFEPEPTGTNTISFQPRFSYNISRNLSGAFSVNFSRNKNIGTDVVTTTIGLGLEAEFVF
ncbi:hypothetical protein GF314_08815 [bacterium]|nr:hypothetical protein [bacterium]